MKNYIYSFIAIILFLPVCVEAASCTKEQVSRYEQLANQIQTTLEYHETEDGITFDIIFHNVHEDFYIVDYYNLLGVREYKIRTNNVITASNYEFGKSLSFHVINASKKCDGKIIKKIYVITPNYNKYYKDPICKEVSNFELCKKWVNIGKLSYDNFLKSVNAYKESLILEDTENEHPIEDNWINNVRNFFGQYYIYIILVIFLIVILIMFLINKRKKKF